MEKSNKEVEKSIYNLMKNAEVEQPSVNFLSNVMEAVSKQSVEQKAYQPLISKNVWLFIAATLVIGVVLLSLYPVTSLGIFSQYSISEALSFNIQMPEIKVSKTMIYGIGFLSLFLLQIPFIKHYHNKRYI